MRVITRTLIMILIGFAIAFGVKYLFGYEVTSFTLLIIPVGSFILGAIMGYGIPSGMIKSNMRKNKIMGMVSFALAMICLVGVHFMFYSMTYVDDNLETNYKFQGDHVSQYVIQDNNQQVNFLSFKKLEMDTSGLSLTRHGRELASFDSNATINWIKFGIESLAFVLGFVVIYSSTLDSAIFCEDCSVYMKSKKSFKIVTMADKNLQRLHEILEHGSFGDVNQFVHDHKPDSKPVGSLYIEGNTHLCEECGTGHLVTERYFEKKEGKYSKETNGEKKYPLRKDIAKTFFNPEKIEA